MHLPEVGTGLRFLRGPINPLDIEGRTGFVKHDMGREGAGTRHVIKLHYLDLLLMKVRQTAPHRGMKSEMVWRKNVQHRSSGADGFEVADQVIHQ